MKHTPGPWEFDETPNGKEETRIIHQGFPLAIVRGTDDMSCIDDEEESAIIEECIANAQLIASAPETAAERDRLKELNKELIETLKKLLPKLSQLQDESAFTWPEKIEKLMTRHYGNQCIGLEYSRFISMKIMKSSTLQWSFHF